MAGATPITPFSWLTTPPSSVIPFGGPGFSSVPNPNLEDENAVRQDAAANPYAYWGGTETPTLHPSLDPKQRANADAAQRSLNQAAGAVAADDRAAGVDMTHQAIVPQRVSGSSINATGAGAINPWTGLPVGGVAGQWQAGGGSQATMHRAQVASGRRPAIDARTTYAPGNFPSGASASIIAGFGSGPGQVGHSPWPVTPMGTAGSALWSQMTQKFNQDNATRAARLATAQSGLQSAISDNPAPSGPMSIGGDETA